MTAIFDAITEPIAKRITAGLERIAAVLRSRAWKGAGPAGVTPTQAQALAALRDAPDGVRLAVLAERLGVSAPTASEAVNALVAKGLAAKGAGPDRRSVTLRLTAAGGDLVARAGEWPEFLARAVDTLDAAEQAGFLRSLATIIRTLQENGDIPAQRLCVTCRFFRPYAHDDPASPHHCAYVDAAFADRHLRLNCAEQQTADAAERAEMWRRFREGPGEGRA